jgi:DNA-binding transcriptional LysR family regulator
MPMVPFSRFSAYFLEVVRQGSLRRAGEVLHVSASAIRQILQAEIALGAALFERLPGGLKLTAAGELVLADVKRWRKEFSRTLEGLDELKGLKRGHVRIALIEALAEGIIVQAVGELAVEHPYVTFDVRVLGNRDIADQVGAAEVDFGIFLDPADNAALEIRASVEIPLGVAMPTNHPLAGKTRISLSTSLAYRHLISAAPLIVYERAQKLYAQHKLAHTHAVECNNVVMMRALIRKGVGIGILSLLDVKADLDGQQLAFVPLQGRNTKPLTLALCVARRRQLSRAAQMVVQRVAQAMKTLA